MISKELLGEVLERDVDKVKGIEANTLIYGCVHSDGWYDEINIYELAHKCKEWAYSQGYIISSGLTPVLGVNKDGWAEVFSSSTPLGGKLHTFKQLSEPEAIFKASEYILKEIRWEKN